MLAMHIIAVLSALLISGVSPRRVQPSLQQLHRSSLTENSQPLTQVHAIFASHSACEAGESKKITKSHGMFQLLKMLAVLFSASNACALFSVSSTRSMPQSAPPMYRGRVLETYAHDSAAFTQGLYYEPGSKTLLESTGLYGRSSMRRVHLESGRVIKKMNLPQEVFGEGCAVCDGTLFQLSWREGFCMLRDAETLKYQKSLPLPDVMQEGWGLTADGTSGKLYASDGSSKIFVLNSQTLMVERAIEVRAGRNPLYDINDLQWVRGEIWANVWFTDNLAVINPETGNVRCFVDLSQLLTSEERSKMRRDFCLNGIAFDEAGDRLFVTGKCWNKLMQIEVPQLEGASGIMD
mmetsp:Transcript_14013/g.25214  ORF Transcript_14013/g.25214 Transcript_14013/m.25214 type:complete len:350 (+) Transcript_14013:60-1109(+)